MTAEEAELKALELYKEKLREPKKKYYAILNFSEETVEPYNFSKLNQSDFKNLRSKLSAKMIEELKSILGESMGYKSYRTVDSETREQAGKILSKPLEHEATLKAEAEAIEKGWADTIIQEAQKNVPDNFKLSYSIENGKISFHAEELKKKVAIKVKKGTLKETSDDDELIKQFSEALEKFISISDARISKKITYANRFKGNFQDANYQDLKIRGKYVSNQKLAPMYKYDEQGNATPVRQNGELGEVSLDELQLLLSSENRLSIQHNLNYASNSEISTYVKEAKDENITTTYNLAKAFNDFYNEYLKVLSDNGDITPENFQHFLSKESYLKLQRNISSGPKNKPKGNRTLKGGFVNVIPKNEAYIFENKDYSKDLKELTSLIEDLEKDFIGGRVLKHLIDEVEPTVLLNSELVAAEFETIGKKHITVTTDIKEDIKEIADSERKYFSNQLEKFKKNFTLKDGSHPFEGQTIQIYPTLEGEIETKKSNSLAKKEGIVSYAEFHGTKIANGDSLKLALESQYKFDTGDFGSADNIPKNSGFALPIVRLNKRAIKVGDERLDYAEIKKIPDLEAQMVYEYLLNVAQGNYDLVNIAIGKLQEKWAAQNIQKVTNEDKYSGVVEIIDPDSRLPVKKKFRDLTEKDLSFLDNRERAERADKRNKRMIKLEQSGVKDALNLPEETLKMQMRGEFQKAQWMWEDELAYVREQSRINLQAKLPQFPADFLNKKIDLVLDRHGKQKSLYQQYKQLNKRSSTRYSIAPKSAQLGVGVQNIFNGGFDIAVRYIQKNRNSSKSANVDIDTDDKQSLNWDEDTIKQRIMIRKSSIQPLNIRRFQKKHKRPFFIPKSFLFKNLVVEHYGSLVAAGMFQLLVSNTPIDEPYDYIENRTYIKKGKIDLRKLSEYTIEDQSINIKSHNETMENTHMHLGKETVSADQIYNAWTEGSEKVVYKVHHHHEPDNDIVRDDWEFNYKGRIFKPTDKCFKNEDQDENGDIITDLGLFDKPGDRKAIATIAHIFEEQTKNSTIKTYNFTYRNTNKRWEQLEYGGYIRHGNDYKSGPWKGQGKYQKLHGTTDGYTWQAPHGWLRLIEAQWNMILESKGEFDFIEEFIKQEHADVSTLAEDFINDLKKYDSSIGTHNYDLQNWVIIEGE